MCVTGSAKNCDYYKILQSMFVNNDVQLQHNEYVGSPLGSSSYPSDCGHYFLFAMYDIELAFRCTGTVEVLGVGDSAYWTYDRWG